MSGTAGDARPAGGAPCRAAELGGFLEPVRSGGALLWREGAEGVEVVLVRRSGRGDLTLPKGKLKDGEHLVAGAVREVVEETGLTPVLGRRLPPQHYLKDGWPKRVEWWAATPAGGSGEIDRLPDEEIDLVEWVPAGRARTRLTHDHDVEVLDHFLAGPAETFPVVVLRHMSAGDRHTWEGDDLLRPLDAVGRADALALPPLLGAYGEFRVVTSAAARCAESVLPYTVRSGMTARTERAFTVLDGHGPDREAARGAFARVLGEGLPTVVCTHGELVPDLVEEGLTRLGAPVPRQLGLGKGAFWVLHVSVPGGELVSAERHGVGG